MDRNKLSAYTAITGEILVAVGAATWIINHQITSYIFALGAILMTAGRLIEPLPQHASTTLRRLYTQRNTGTIILLLAAILMFTHQYINQQELGDYIIKATPTAWLLPFVVFVAIELYTAIRIPSQHNKEQEQA